MVRGETPSVKQLQTEHGGPEVRRKGFLLLS
jgi:hypothetical protein